MHWSIWIVDPSRKHACSARLFDAIVHPSVLNRDIYGENGWLQVARPFLYPTRSVLKSGVTSFPWRCLISDKGKDGEREKQSHLSSSKQNGAGAGGISVRNGLRIGIKCHNVWTYGIPCRKERLNGYLSIVRSKMYNDFIRMKQSPCVSR